MSDSTPGGLRGILEGLHGHHPQSTASDTCVDQAIAAIGALVPEKEEYGAPTDDFSEWTRGWNDAIEEIQRNFKGDV